MKRSILFLLLLTVLLSCENEDDLLENGTCESSATMVWDCQVFPDSYYEEITQDEWVDYCLEEQEMGEEQMDEMMECFLECEVNQDCDGYTECIVFCTGPDENEG